MTKADSSDVDALRAQIARYQALTEQSPFSTQIFDARGNTIQVNRAWELLWGTTLAELGRYNILEDAQLVERGIRPYIDRAFAGEPVAIPEIPYCPPSGRFEGQEIWVRAFMYPVRGEDGSVTEVVLMHEDVSERRRAETALVQSEERFRRIIETAEEGIWIVDTGGRTTFVNRRMTEILGYSREELIGRICFDLLEPEDAETGRRTFEARKQGDTGRREYRVRRRDGTQIWLSFTGSVLTDKAGQVIGVLAMCVDTTERKQSEEQLRHAHNQLNAIVHNSPLPIVALSAEGKVTVWNAAAERTFGWSESEVLGKPLPFIPEEKMAEHREMRARDLAGEGFTGLEIRRRRKDGSPIDLSVSTAPLRDQGGRVVGIMSLYVDITEQKRIQQALTESEEKYRFLAEAIPHLVWTATPDGKIEYANARALRYFDVATPDLMTVWAIDRVHPDDRAHTEQSWVRSLQTGDVYEVETRLRHPNGEYHWHLVRAIPVREASGAILRWFGTSTDIESQKRTEADLRRANEDLNQFAYSASHDLQEPLRMIGAYSQLLQRKYGSQLDADADQFIAYTVEGVRRMRELINDLLAYTQAVNLNGDDNAVADANRVLNKALLNLAGAIRTSGADIAAETLPEVRMSETHLLQVFQNLIGNAIKYRSADPPRIRISATRFGPSWQFSVQDNGIGIPPEYAGQIFGIFKRLHPTSEYSGTGIGLAICQKIVERYRGQIRVDSPGSGRGTTFRFTVPAADTPRPAQAAAVSSNPVAPA